MLSILAASLVLTLEPSTPSTPPSAVPQAALFELTPEGGPQLRSKYWTAAGGYGMGAMFGGAAGILVEYSTRHLDNTRNVKPPLLSMLAGFIGGAIPGAVLGDSARVPDNERARGAVGILDVAGSAALFYAFTQIFRSRG